VIDHDDNDDKVVGNYPVNIFVIAKRSSVTSIGQETNCDAFHIVLNFTAFTKYRLPSWNWYTEAIVYVV
jgi:hypothetical protein